METLPPKSGKILKIIQESEGKSDILLEEGGEQAKRIRKKKNHVQRPDGNRRKNPDHAARKREGNRGGEREGSIFSTLAEPGKKKIPLRKFST